jgi:hypothetical protein
MGDLGEIVLSEQFTNIFYTGTVFFTNGSLAEDFFIPRMALSHRAENLSIQHI